MKTYQAVRLSATILMLVLSLCPPGLKAQTSIAVLDFELKDLTLKPGIPAEIERTSSIKPMLENELKKSGYRIVSISAESQQQAAAGVGYLLEHHDVAAELAGKYGADYVVVGRLHKPSFLFVYLMVHLIRADNGKLIGNYLTEIKGGEKKLTLKGVEDLAVKINETLNP